MACCCRARVLLIVVGFHDIAGDGAGNCAAVFAALDEHGNHNFRIAPRSIAYEPGIVLEFFLLAHAIAHIIANHLRASGFAAEFDVLKPRAGGRPAFVDYAVHSLGHFLDRIFGNGEMIHAGIRKVFQEVRLDENASTGNARNHARELDRRGGHGALTHGDGNRFASVPLAMIHALRPFLGRNQTGLFAGQINSRAMAEAESVGVERDAIDSEQLADVVEVDVAGLHDGFVQVHIAVAASCRTHGT